MTLSPEDVLATIPGWENGTCTVLCGGLTNPTWHVSIGDRSGVLKVDQEPRRAPFNTRCDEAYVQNSAAKVGLAPPVVLANDGFILSVYADGTVWGRDSLDKDGNLEMLAAALKRLHALPLTGRSFDASVAAKRYVEKVTGLEATVVKQCTEIISNMRLPLNLCCCHNDLVAQNVITTPDVMLLDWEYACDNDPFFDLATIVEHHELNDAQARTLLNAYFDGDGERWRGNLEKQRQLYLALLCLWMAARPDCDAVLLQETVARLPTSYS